MIDSIVSHVSKQRLKKLVIIVKRAYAMHDEKITDERAVGIAMQVMYMATNGISGFRQMGLGNLHRINPNTLEISVNLRDLLNKVRDATIMHNLVLLKNHPRFKELSDFTSELVIHREYCPHCGK